MIYIYDNDADYEDNRIYFLESDFPGYDAVERLLTAYGAHHENNTGFVVGIVPAIQWREKGGTDSVAHRIEPSDFFRLVSQDSKATAFVASRRWGQEHYAKREAMWEAASPELLEHLIDEWKKTRTAPIAEEALVWLIEHAAKTPAVSR